MPLSHTPEKRVVDSAMDAAKPLIYQRGQVKAKVTTLLKQIERAEQDTSQVSLPVLKVISKKLDSHYAEFNMLHEKVLNAIPSAKLEEQDEKVSEFEALHTDALIRVECLIEMISKSSNPMTAVAPIPSTSTSQFPQIVVQQQPLQAPIPTFDGKYENWPRFKALFTDIIGRCTDSDAIKLHHLDKALVGAAADIIDSKTLVENNYAHAWDILVERFENKRVIIDSHLSGLLNLKKMAKESHSELRALIETCDHHVEGLKFLNQPIDGTASLFVNKLLISCLDPVTRKSWERTLKHGDIPDLKATMIFLKDQCRVLERCESDRSQTIRQTQDKPSPPFSKFANAKIHATTTLPKSNLCTFCDKEHLNYQCTEFRNMAIPDRLHKVKETRVCFNCLRRGHRCTDCPSKSTCSKCKRRHHTLLHIETSNVIESTKLLSEPSSTSIKSQPKPNIQSTENSKRDQSSQSHLISSSCSVNVGKAHLPNVLLLTAIVNLIDSKGQVIPCRAFLDCGAQTNLISDKMCRKLGLDGVSVNIDVLGVGNARFKANRLVTVRMNSQHTDYKANLRCLVVPRITSHMPGRSINIADWKIPPELRLADPSFHNPSDVDLLIGITHFFSLMKPGQYIIGHGLPELRETELGWVVSGEVHDSYEPVINSQLVNAVSIESLNEMIKRFWEVEELEDAVSPQVEEHPCEQSFRETHRRNDSGRFVVDLPFRDNVNLLDDNRSSALRRFFFLEKRLQQNPELHRLYSQFIDEYESLGHCKEIQEKFDQPGKLVYYLPHHAVLRPTSSSTKLRVVFDASAKSTASAKSLNEVMHVGPVVQNDLISILLHFRRFPFAFTADISKMYRQILVNPEQTSVQRIFWRGNPSESLRILELQTVTYGTAAAPFLATRSLVQLCEDEGSQYPLASRIIRQDCYVDDLITGADTIEEAIESQRQIRLLLSKGQFPIHKWCANEARILRDIPDNEREKLVYLNQTSADQVIKTLGLIWNPSSDMFLFAIDLISDDKPITKRRLFSIVARLFDPLGFLSPTVVLAKQLMQRTWVAKLKWDCPLEGELLETWSQFYSALQHVNKIEIPRFISVPGSSIIELHGFADASVHAYGACLYVRSINEEGHCTVRLLCSKSKIAPLKDLTIPRKELCAAVLLTRLTRKVLPALQMHFSAIRLWLDSQIVLAWLKKPPSLLKSFNQTRVKEIVSNNDNFPWSYVRSKENPADVVSRGQLPEKLKLNQLWWEGPPFLKFENYEPTVHDDIPDEKLPDLKPVSVLVMAMVNGDDLPLFKRFSSFRKLQRVLAYVQRFCHNCRIKNRSERIRKPNLTIAELRAALHTIVVVIQQKTLLDEIIRVEEGEPCGKIGSLGPFLHNNALRVGGRLQNSQLQFNSKHQYILPRHPITDLIVRAYHEENLHIGPLGLSSALRQQFWLLGSRSAIRKITRSCIQCFRVKPKRINQYMGNLPECRVLPAAPFEVTGVDYAGPFAIKHGLRKPTYVKAYVAVFVCMVTKAVHLELVSDLTTSAFIAALQRFVSRRGIIREMHSDNATNFQGSKTELHELYRLFRDETAINKIESFCSSKEIEWKFIPPNAPEFGGLWEAAVKSMKFHLKRILKESSLTFEEFTTLLCQVEAILNSRPLFSHSAVPNDTGVITPAHYLIGRPMNSIPEPSYETVKINRLSRWQHLQQMREHFWKSWVRDYLTSLQPRGKNFVCFPNLRPGMIVLMEDKAMPSQTWKMGRIVKVFPGNDNLVRTVDVKVGNTVFRRPITKLSLLPIEDNEQTSSHFTRDS